MEPRSGALAICGRVRTIDLIVSDYNLSRENGLVLAEKLRELLPSIVIIFMSGNLEAHDEVTARGFVCLQKPFDITDIAEAVGRVFGNTRRNPIDI